MNTTAIYHILSLSLYPSRFQDILSCKALSPHPSMRVILALPSNHPPMSTSGPSTSLIPPSLRIPRPGNWLPEDTWVLRSYLTNLVSHVDVSPKPLDPSLLSLQAVIENDAALYMLFHEMFAQIPAYEAYSRDPFSHPQIRDYKHLLRLINHIITSAPKFADAELIGLPINALLDYPMSTPAGQTAFLSPALNGSLKSVLGVWAQYLSSPASACVLNESQTGWLGPPALAAMRASSTSRREPGWRFENTFICNPVAPHYGFVSWDDFFTRRFRPGVRPVAGPGDADVIVNPCECAPWRICGDVQRKERFWLKGQRFSLCHMLADEGLGRLFEGGVVYQAWLEAVAYHRWHVPVGGTVKSVRMVEGTYFSRLLGRGGGGIGSGGERNGDGNGNVNVRTKRGHSKSTSLASNVTSRGGEALANIQCENYAYTAAVATRAVVVIDADNPAIGSVALVFVGLAEVSTCDVQVVEGQRVRKGEDIGTFRFGGSSVCMVIKKGVDLVWDLHGQEIGLGARNIPVNSRIANVVGKREKKVLVMERKRGVRGRAQQHEGFYKGWRGEMLGM